MTNATKIVVGSKVTFWRGKFGRWPGTVRKLYKSRQGWVGHSGGELWAVVSFTRKNGSFGRARVSVSSLVLQ